MNVVDDAFMSPGSVENLIAGQEGLIQLGQFARDEIANDHVDTRDPSVLLERCFRYEDICLSVVERVHSEGVQT